MKILFMGTPSFARVVLKGLLSSEKHQVCAVFTKQDAVSKRGNKLIPSEVKELCLEEGLEVFTPKTLKDGEVQHQIRDLGIDVICVAAYGKILPKEVLEIPKFGCLNVHASLLPRWRGAAPIERAILAGDKHQGVSIMKMEEGLDTGDFCLQKSVSATEKSAVEITSELAELGAVALCECLDSLEKGKSVSWKKQDENEVTYAEKIEKRELFLDPSCSAEMNLRRVLASADSHPAKCIIDGKTVRIMSAKAEIDSSETSDDCDIYSETRDVDVKQTISTAEDAMCQCNNCASHQNSVRWVGKKLYLECCHGDLCVISLKPDGKKEMPADSFVAGCRAIREGIAKWEKCE